MDCHGPAPTPYPSERWSSHSSEVIHMPLAEAVTCMELHRNLTSNPSHAKMCMWQDSWVIGMYVKVGGVLTYFTFY